MPNTFILNDENVVNSYGFRTKNAGSTLDRFRANPVILAQHLNNLSGVVGRWVNIRIEGSKLLADAEFDEEDPDAAKIAGKVKRGFLKGVSLGLRPVGTKAFEMSADGIPDLVSSEVMEASIVAIPSNRSALKLYAAEGVEMSEDQIKLSVTTLSENFIPTNMNKITLTAQTLVLLGLNTTENMVEVQAAVELMAKNFEQSKSDLKTSNDEVLALKAKLKGFESTEAIKLVDAAINAKKLGADQREAFLKLAETDFTSAKNLIDGMSPRTDLGGQINNPSTLDITSIKTEEDFQKLSLNDQLDFKKNHFEEYKKLFNA